MRSFSHCLRHPASLQLSLGFLFLLMPLASRYQLGWSHPFGYLSDLALGSAVWLLLLPFRQRSVVLSLVPILLWCLLLLGNAELVNAVGRMPEPADLAYLGDVQFLSHSTRGSGLSQPLLAMALTVNVVLYLLLRWRQPAPPRPRLSATWWLAPLSMLAVHALFQYRSPSEAEQWLQFNLPHKLLLESSNAGLLKVQDWLHDDRPASPADMAGLTRLDLDGTPLLDQPGAARNVLIITLEGIPGTYLAASRRALHSNYQQAPMPRLSQWAERGMLTVDYVLHSHQTIRGLYAMLCGDYGKLDSGTPKGLELLNNPRRSQQCLPAQLRTHGFSTHYLQGAGLRFMAKDQIMPQMGFEQTLGRDWFTNPAYLEFPWGMDDKAFFEGALGYVRQLRQQQKPWLLTLLTVGTHQPYSAPADYLQRYPNAKQAAIAYLDDAVGDFLIALERQGVLEDTLVIVTSDESHGIENVRLASAWGFNLLLAPEQEQLPAIKGGVYGHVDLTASVLDYLALPLPDDIAGRSLLRDYASGREILSYTNGLLRQHDGRGTFTECDFQQVCRRYASPGFIADSARYLGRVSGPDARRISQRARLLDQSLRAAEAPQHYQFANRAPITLKASTGDDWADNLVGAQYLELPRGSRTTVSLQVRAVHLDRHGARLQLKAKEYDRDVALPLPELPLLQAGQPLELSFAFDNLAARKAFSFHLLGQGQGAIEITDFRVASAPLPPKLLAAKTDEDKPRPH